MSKSKRTPQYRRQKRRGRPDLAFVEFAGQRMYIGEFGTVESRAKYVRIIRAASYSLLAIAETDDHPT